jgi:hypothetical protein
MSERNKFFVSYNKADRRWAEWIAWMLEEEGHEAGLDVWDVKAGGSITTWIEDRLKEAQYLVLVLSPNYFSSEWTQAEWKDRVYQDPAAKRREILPVRVAECEIPSFLRDRKYVDLVGLDGEAARKALREGVALERGKPARQPEFPGLSGPQENAFPGEPAEQVTDSAPKVLATRIMSPKSTASD